MKNIRLLIFVILGLGIFLSFFLFLQFAELLFNIHNKYEHTPVWLLVLYFSGIALLAIVSTVIIWKVRKIGSKPRAAKAKQREITDDQSFQNKLAKLSALSADTDAIEADWHELLKIRQQKTVNIALFGEINVGKSSLIASLTEQQPAISAAGGETTDIHSYPFTHQQLHYCLFDMPGIAEAFGQSEKRSTETAIKSHVVVFVVDQEFTHSTFEAYKKLLGYKKPIIIALNKADYYRDDEKALIRERIKSHFLDQQQTPPPILWVQAKTTKTVERHHPDGRIESAEVVVPADINALLFAIDNLAADQLKLSEQLDHSYFQLLEEQIDDALKTTRKSEAEKVIKTYMQRAIIGGVAAVGPGTDILLQGYFCIEMTKKICQIYDVDASEIELEALISSINSKLKKQISLILALVGNVHKAFTGIGTVTGGALHAIAYGLIFESLGRALVTCFEKDAHFEKKDIIKAVEDELSGNLETRTRKLVQTILLKK